MNLPFFIANKIIRHKNKQTFSKPIVSIAFGSIAVGLTTMILAISIVDGFKNAITEKVSAIGAHVQITSLSNMRTMQSKPIDVDNKIKQLDQELNFISHVHPFVVKNVLLQMSGNVEAVLVKGVGSGYYWEEFSKNIYKGNVNNWRHFGLNRNAIIISETLAKQYNIQYGDTIKLLFVKKSSKKQSLSPRSEKVYVDGIYNTGVVDLDENLIFADINFVQSLYGWHSGQISGYEILVTNFENIDEYTQAIRNHIPYQMDAQNIKTLFPAIFSWLPTLNINSIIVIVLMVIVSILAMISTLLILILERTQMIGVLKAMGLRTRQIRQVFMYQATYIIVRGLIIGNILGVGLALLQKTTQWIKLDESVYYISQVPVLLSWSNILLLNVGTLVVCMLALVVPSLVVSKISPVKAIRLD